MLEELLNSKTRVKVLSLFFSDERKDYYSQEVITLTKADPANAHRELVKLTKLGVLKMKTKDGRKFYSLNSGSPYFRGLKDLIENNKEPIGHAGLQYLNDGDAWILGEDIPDMDLFFSQIWLSGFANDFERHVGLMYKKVLCIHEGYHLWFYYGDQDSNRVGQHIVNRLIKNPAFAVTVNQEIIKTSDRLRQFAATLPEDMLDKLTNAQLWKLFKTHDQIHTTYYEWGWIPVAADMFHNNLTNAFIAELRRRQVPAEKVNEYFAVLTQPIKKSLIQREKEDFLTLADTIQSDPYHKKLFKDLYRVFEEQEATPLGLKTHTPEYEGTLERKAQTIRGDIKPKIYKLIEQHFAKYFYMKHMWIGQDGVYSFEYYLKELVKFIGRNSDAKALRKENDGEFRDQLKKRTELMAKLKITGAWKTLFDAFGDFMVTKIYRRFAQIYAIYRMQPVLEEIARRVKISKMQARFMLTAEVGEALLRNKVNRSELEARIKFCAYYVERDREIVFTGAEAEALAQAAKPKALGDVTEITGQVGCVGKAKGRVKIIIRPADMAKMNEGDVLVSIATDPDIVPAMKKAAAIVTEQGGVTSHAAIVSRELNIPCVIGTKIATRVLKDGDLVEVDATKGVVTKL